MSTPLHACCRFTVPASVLEPSVITAFFVLCNKHGSVIKVVDAGKLLVLASEAAAEVRDLFSKTTAQVQQLLAGSSLASSTATSPQLPPSGVLQHTLSSLLERIGGRWQNRTCQATASRTSAAGTSSSGDLQHTAPCTTAAAAHTTAVELQQPQAVQPPEAAALYAYEHFFVPFMRQWLLVFSACDEQPALHNSSGLCGPSASGSVEAQTMPLLGLLLENEMWACSLEILARYPAMAAHVQRAGIKPPEDDACSSMLLQQLCRVLRPAPTLHEGAASFQLPQQQAPPQQLSLSYQQPTQGAWHHQQHVQLPADAAAVQHSQLLSLQQQLQRLSLQQQLQRLSQQHLQHQLLSQQQQQQQPDLQSMPPAAGLPWAPPARVGSNSSDDSLESGSEILVRLGLLQQVRGEHEALAALLQEEQQLPQPSHLAMPGQQQEQEQQVSVGQVPLVHQPAAPSMVPAADQQQHLARASCPDVHTSQAVALSTSGELIGGGSVARTASAPLSMLLALAQQASAAEAAMCQSVSQPLPVPFGESVGIAVGAVLAAGGQQGPVTAHCAEHAGVSISGAAVPAAAQGGMPVEAAPTGLRQRRPGAVVAGSLFSKQRKLSWEEEQPEPVPSPPPMPAPVPQACASPSQGWYPGSWQLPEPSSSLAMPAGAFAAAVGLGGACTGAPVAARAGEPGCIEDCQAIQDPYSEPSYAANVDSTSQPDEELYGDNFAGAYAAAECCKQASFAGGVHSRDPLPVADCSSKGTSCSYSKGESSTGKGTGSCSDTCGSADAANALQQAPSAVGWQQLMQLCCSGFHDPNLEASYVVFKNHGCSLLDATAGFICTAMLLTSTLRSLNLKGELAAWFQLVTLAVYGVCFFLPYIVMKLRLQVFLRLREQLLVYGRSLGAVILAIMALGYLPMVLIWRNVVVNTLSLQIQNGLILPACQQVRLPAAVMIAAVHVPADAIWLAVGKPFQVALLHSTLMQLSSVAVTLFFDAWCRLRFLQRYSGVMAHSS